MCLTCRNVSGNALSGPLPTNWGWDNVLTLLEVLALDGNAFSGSIPTGFGTSGAFKSLLVLNLDGNNFSGRPRLTGQRAHLSRMEPLADHLIALHLMHCHWHAAAPAS